MHRNLIFIFLTIILGQAWGQGHSDLVTYGKVLPRRRSVENVETLKAAACVPATGLRDLEWNNVSALIETGGSLWQDRANGRSHYFVPKEGNTSVLFAGSLWMGGISPDQQLKMAAILYRYDGNDYWPGPLTNDGTASTNEANCEQWDRFYVSYRQDAQRHRQFFECANTPGCNPEESMGGPYAIPSYFYNYPAMGNTAAGQDLYIAPFYDYDQDGVYMPQNGDYPWFDFTREINCAGRKREDIVPLYGDVNYYWVFNDKGNAHTESQGQPIGMEIRAQAFAFNTNDEINNMTFYNYVLINQGTQTLTETYFGTWIDCDVGGHTDDYVGCDVQRGLGYGYNGPAVDNPTGLSPGYGASPPAVGVDFFEGPYQDEDSIDNPLTTDIIEAIDQKGIPYKGIGIGYGDGVVDNERFGMRRFLYHGSGSGPAGYPTVAIHYYNYLRGFWKNGQRMAYGGNALSEASGADLSIGADYMFPGDTDPLNFGTLGTSTAPWTEVSSGNPAGDRRFMQSAGPFTLEPGDYNNITVGVVYARSQSGTPFESVNLVRVADDKAQALFDNCFELISGPDAPDVTVRELDREIILMLSNDNPMSSNYNEDYSLLDPTIPEFDSELNPLSEEDRKYKFEGFMIYQLANAKVTSADLYDITKARLIAQCDVQNGVANIVNFGRDVETSSIMPTLQVQGSDQGIRRAFQVKSDAFAQGDSRLINHKTYYFMAVAYGYNNYEQYNVALGTGQDQPFLASRKSVFGEIPVIAAIPHNNQPGFGGAILNAQYGDGVVLTRIEGRGNGLSEMTLDPATEAEILNNIRVSECKYLPGMGPVDVKVVDPLALPAADFELSLESTSAGELAADSMYWQLINLTSGDTLTSTHSFKVGSEDILLDYGLSINWSQYQFMIDGTPVKHYTEFLSGTMEFADPSKPWFAGIPDAEGFFEGNWIRAGAVKTEGTDATALFEQLYDDFEQGSGIEPFTDASEAYEGVVGGTWGPYCLAAYSVLNFDVDGDPATPGETVNNVAPTINDVKGDNNTIDSERRSSIRGLNNVDIVFTKDKSKWTRVPVFEMNANGLAEDVDGVSNGTASKMKMRHHLSVDKNGKVAGESGYNAAEGDLNGLQPWGMGWFPGYAVDLGTGERLNLAFGEDSWLVGENGNDMLWNPTSNLISPQGFGQVAAGQHWIYVFKNFAFEDNSTSVVPAYDNGQFMYDQLSNTSLSSSNWKKLFRACTWVGSAALAPGYSMNSVEDGLIPNDLRVRLRVAKEYDKFRYNSGDVNDASEAQNAWRPLYHFSTKGIAPVLNNNEALTNALDMINVVPNPYYAFSLYETNKLDNRVKITNLPEECTVTIYDMNGTMIRQFKKADPLTSLDWDLKNGKNIPIASGTYIIHVNVPGAGEKVLKWFGVMRPVDLDNF